MQSDRPVRKALEVASHRRVRVDTGEDGRQGLVVFHYADDPRTFHTISREAFFLGDRYVVDFEPTII